MQAVIPDHKQLAKYERVEHKFADFHGDTLVFGDSRAKQWPKDQLGSLGFGSVCNMGITVDLVQYALWRAENTTVDLSHVTNCVVEIGINNLNRTQDAPADVADGIRQIVDVLTARMAPGAHVYVMEVFEEVPRGFGTEDLRQQLNTEIQKLPPTFTFVDLPAMDPTDPLYFTEEGCHLTYEGYATFMTPALAAAMELPPLTLEHPSIEAWAV